MFSILPTLLPLRTSTKGIAPTAVPEAPKSHDSEAKPCQAQPKHASCMPRPSVKPGVEGEFQRKKTLFPRPLLLSTASERCFFALARPDSFSRGKGR